MIERATPPPLSGEQEELDLLRGLLPDVRILIRDYYSGLPEDREPVDRAMTRLSHQLEDEDGNALDHVVPLDPALREAREVEQHQEEKHGSERMPREDPFVLLRVVARRCRLLEAELAEERTTRDNLALRLIDQGETWRAVAEAGGFENPYIAALKRKRAATPKPVVEEENDDTQRA